MSSTPAPAPAAAPAAAQESFLSSHFVVQLGAPQPIPVTVVSGIQADTPAVVTREGSDPASGEKTPGQASYPNLVLTRPLTRDLTLWQWMQDSISGAAVKKNIVVLLVDSQANPVIEWSFRNAFPVRWTGPVLNALSNDAAMETLEIAHEGFTVTAP
ncbi:MAG TPA: phage tail protein [Bryobacteraceae bacterium]|nr:phage tail protein [Bryobacteraceae bacterium]